MEKQAVSTSWLLNNAINMEMLIFIYLRFYLFMFRQRGRDGEREGKKHQCVVASRVPPTGDLDCKTGMCPDWELNR